VFDFISPLRAGRDRMPERQQARFDEAGRMT
jgi:hypothetical protein